MPGTSGGEVLSVVIIGCGGIAGGYDEEADHGLVLSHAGAYWRHSGFRITACVEPDPTRRSAFMRRWDIPAGYGDLDTFLDEQRELDVASICSPTPTHGSILDRLLATQVRAVFCEKPMTLDIGQSARLIGDYARAGKQLCVNYTRRWDAEMVVLRDELTNGQWGKVRSACGYYAKGLRHTGSHMIDLLQFFLGPLDARLVFRRTHDFASDDATIDALLHTSSNALVYLVGGDCTDYARFELTISCEKGVIEIYDSGFRTRRRSVTPHRHYPGSLHLAEGRVVDTGLGVALAAALDNLYGAVTKGIALASDGGTALSAETLCYELAQLQVAS